MLTGTGIAYPCFIAPMYFCFLLLRSCCYSCYSRILLIKPFANCRWPLLISFFQGLLWSEGPTGKIFPRSPYRHLNSQALPDQLTNCLPGPESKRKLMLIRSVIRHHLLNLFFVQRARRTARRTVRSDWFPSLFRLETFGSGFLIGSPPIRNRLPSHPNDFTGSNGATALLLQADRLLSQDLKISSVSADTVLTSIFSIRLLSQI